MISNSSQVMLKVRWGLTELGWSSDWVWGVDDWTCSVRSTTSSVWVMPVSETACESSAAWQKLSSILRYQDQTSDSFSDTEVSAQVYALDSQSNTTTITIANVPIQVIVDQRASCNVLNTADSEKLVSHGLRLRTCNRTLIPYNSPPLKVI